MRRLHPIVLGALAALLPALAPAATAQAECTEAAPSVGVILRDCTEGGLRWAEVRADLVAADVGLRVSRPGERAQTVEDWAGSVAGAVVAVQGGPFSFPDYGAVGLTVGDGEPWSGGSDDARLGVLAFDERGAGLLAPAEQVVPAEDWMQSAVSGIPVLRDGTALECAGQGCEPRPRTAVGLGDDGRTLVIVTVQGWTADSPGVTDRELGEMARAAGAADALRTGEGATSVLWSSEGAMVIGSSDGGSRPTAAFLGVVDRASGAEARIRGVVKQAADPMDVLPDARIRIETTDGRLVVESGTMTAGAYFEHTVPAREYFVKASHAGYRTACKYCPVSEGGEMWCSVFLAAGDGAETCDAPAWGVEAGPWPVGQVDAGMPDAGTGGVDAGPDDPGVDGGCAVSGRGAAGGSWLLGFVLALAARRKVRRPR